VKLTRRQVLGGAAAGALGAAGVYELVDRLGSSPERPATAAHPPEQHVLDGVRIVEDGGVEVLVPSLHHEVVTAKVGVDGRDLRDAQRALEDSLRGLDERYEASPAGLGVTVAWGLPYFETHVADAWRRNEPRDRRAERAALLPTRRFPSDPAETVLEENDVAILLRSDEREHIEDAAQTLFEQVGVFRVTSIRKGFAGGGFDGGSSLPKRLAMAAGVPGADLIPDGAELFLGFTSTQRTGLGPRKIVNFETLGLVDVGEGYFREGTHMHLSHIHEQLDTWYQLFDFRDRVDTTFRPGLTVAPGTLTVRQAQEDVSAAADVTRDFDRGRTIGHSAALQTASRLHADHVAEDGVVYPAGTAIPHRADFNTLDNPFFWSAAPERDRMRDGPAAGVHFVVFNPSSDDFERIRFAMDGVLPDGTKLEFEPGRGRQGFNSVLRTTHRQNFLVPPRRHRSFPLAEIPV
jgi:hypothetical protein